MALACHRAMGSVRRTREGLLVLAPLTRITCGAGRVTGYFVLRLGACAPVQLSSPVLKHGQGCPRAPAASLARGYVQAMAIRRAKAAPSPTTLSQADRPMLARSSHRLTSARGRAAVRTV